MSRLVMTRADRAALLDALRGMRQGGVAPRELSTSTGVDIRAIYAVAAVPRRTIRVRK